MPSSASITAVVPMKPFERAKTRLAGALGDEMRVRLARALFAQTLRVLASHPSIAETLVVSAGPAVLAEARAAGAIAVHDPEGDGLNGALGVAVAAAVERGAAAVLFLPADIPMLTVDDISRLADSLPAGREGVVIAPDRHGSGTNALLLRPPALMPPRFGLRSFQGHREAARRLGIAPVIVDSPALGLDIDEAADLALVPDGVVQRLLPRASEPV